MAVSVTYKDPSLLGDAGYTGADMAGAAAGPGLMKTLTAYQFPKWATIPFQARKQRNTILEGGFGGPSYPGAISNWAQNQLHPRSVNRFSNQDYFQATLHPQNLFFDKKANAPTWLGRKLEGVARKGQLDDAGFLSKNVTKLAKQTGFVDDAGKVTHALDYGMSGRFMAYNKIARKGLTPEQTGNVMSFMKTTNPGLVDAMEESAKAFGAEGKLGVEGINRMMAMGTVQGNISQRVMGFMVGARGGALSPVEEMILDQAGITGKYSAEAGIKAAASGARMAAMHSEQGGSLAAKKYIWGEARNAAEAGLEDGAKTGVMSIAKKAAPDLARSLGIDLAKFLGSDAMDLLSGPAAIGIMAAQSVELLGHLSEQYIVKPGMDLTKDAIRSAVGEIGKAPGGMGFKDNTVAATSRQRGVMAIQNSRLNARSALGNEASMMAARYA